MTLIHISTNSKQKLMKIALKTYSHKRQANSNAFLGIDRRYTALSNNTEIYKLQDNDLR